MKTILIALSLLLMGEAAYSQSTVTLKVTGNRAKQIIVDTKTYPVNNTTTTAISEIVIDNLAAGTHSIEMIRGNTINNTSKSSFITRDGYDLLLTIAANGSISTSETRNTQGNGGGWSRGQLSSSAYSSLLAKVKAKASSTDRSAIIENQFTTSNKKMTAAQASQLIKLVNSESLRFKLAKASYAKISDTENFSLVSNLLNSTANKTALTDYIKSADITTGETATALTTAEYNVIYQEVLAETTNAERVYYLTNFFDRETNFYTAAQASQLIALVNNTSDKNILITKANRGVTDKENFSATGTSTTAMSAANFTTLLNKVKSTYSTTSRYNLVYDAFNSTSNYFTVSQAKQLIALINNENDRLPIAKNAWNNITDPVNYSQLYDLFSSTANRNDLTAYINMQTGTGSTTTKVAMTDTDFNTLYKNLQFSFGIGAKYSSLTDIFNTETNYFTVAQTMKLLQLVSSETNRLELAKLSYNNVTDIANFVQVYDLLPTPANKTALQNFVNSSAMN